MASKNPQQPKTSIKQERELRRLEKVEAFKKQQAREKRNRLIITLSSIVAALVVITLIVVAVVLNDKPKPPRVAVEIGVLKTFPGLVGTHVDPTHVDYFADYGMDPPAGGAHWGQWLNCGIYTQPVPNENAVHDLEHGAVWITYDADALTAEEVTTLQSVGPDTYMVVSPYPDLPTPIVASAWGVQMQFDDVNDPRLEDFIRTYWQAETAPEPGSPCDGGLEAPGRLG